MNDIETISRHREVRRPRVIKEKRHRRLSRLVTAKSNQLLDQLTSQYITDHNRIRSEYTVQMTLLNMA